MSVRGERIVYREREREVDKYEEPQRRSYTTVKRYQVPDRDERLAVFDKSEDVEDNKIVIRRQRREEPRASRSEADFRSRHDSPDRSQNRREEIDVRITERTTEREREREREPERRDVAYRIVERDSDRDRHSGAGSRSEFRFVERDREVVRAPSPPAEERVREYRFERERDYSPVRTATRERDYDIERYSKTTDYYGQPQPIIIRESAPQPPIIIREERRAPPQIIIRREEPAYEVIEREEVREEQQLIVKEDPPPPASTVKSVVKSVKSDVQKPQDEDYYFERRIREVRRRDDDIKPSDSASQYSSDDSYEYIRRERYVDDDDPHHKRHLAEGALAGAAAGAILRSHRKSQGREDTHGARNVLGGAALGAVGAEVISRARSQRGSSRRRGWDEEDDHRSRRSRRHKERSRSRSRSQSKSRVQKLGGLAAVAAVGALAGYAIKKSGQNKETVIINESPRRRSRSRRRRHSSIGSGYPNEGVKHDGEHRNRRIAQAGLASAAAAGIWDRVRSKSRGGRDRSKSRIRTGIPIVGAGLGGAALAGLYERNKASKEATREQIVADERNRGRHRSRSRSAAPYGRRDGSMVAYGNDPLHRDDQRGYYDDEAPGSYQRRDRSVGGSPDNRRRSRSRGRDLATAGAGAAAGAAIAHQLGRSRSRSQNRHDRDRRHDYDDDRYSDEYAHGDYITPPHQGPGAHNYPDSNYFPPPPTEERGAIDHGGYNDPYPAYNPQDYTNTTAGAQHPGYGDNRYNDPAAQAAEARERQEDREMRHAREDARGDPGNVSNSSSSAAVSASDTTGRGGTSVDVNPSTPPSSRVPQVPFAHEADNVFYSDRLEKGQMNDQKVPSGSSTPRARSTSRVRFDLGSNVAHSPDNSRSHRQLSTEESDLNGRGRDEHRTGRPRDRRPSSTLMNDAYERRAPESDSDDTVDLPPRFDEHGNRRPEAGGNDLASRLSEIFSGSGRSSSGSRRSGRNTEGGGGGGMIEQILHGIAGEFRQGDENSGRGSRRSRR